MGEHSDGADVYQLRNGERRSAKAYEYDTVGRLTKSTIDGKATSYTYDAVGNRLTQTSEGKTLSYSYNNLNQPTQHQGREHDRSPAIPTSRQRNQKKENAAACERDGGAEDAGIQQGDGLYLRPAGLLTGSERKDARCQRDHGGR